ncbi:MULTISPECIES: PhnD/SsuA/transferrin family substrate-binding protein [unclassified Caballeronia]|uniref:phosphate/phosphite/phosphonate ABC transporter substrate-binding protein n=1 Tax=unclassified Caballeronia TaxID=2646786 RepID=UPI002862DD97|nr:MULTISPECIES: PhnD/SsuA/transferrin family substrate-binding protein [unclassified Caballeronia]MDR5753907.1 PhnD/SsuA/transferrin family substrate-binding protein [Caballeronia sp. LZ024]MDR5840286.1 PhnD/SsuA/transferrin family substrate-binding protein [Caballeronia sp. LZ031]
MNWIAALPMYNVTPDLASDWRALLAHVGARLEPWLAARGDSLTLIEPDEPLERFWLRDDLLLSQTCGYPLVRALSERVRVIATPAFGIDGCADGNYRSVLVTGAHVDATTLAQCRGLRAAFNDDDSNSGMNLFRAAVAPLAPGKPFFSAVLRTGGHLQSLRALAIDRSADVAAIDCVTLAFARDRLPELADGIREIGVTQSAPGLPFIASKAVPAEAAALLADALDDAVRADPALARRLKLTGFVRRPASDYASILDIERAAVAQGYPVLA